MSFALVSTAGTGWNQSAPVELDLRFRPTIAYTLRSGRHDVANRAGSAAGAGVIHLPASVRVYLCLPANAEELRRPAGYMNPAQIQKAGR